MSKLIQRSEQLSDAFYNEICREAQNRCFSRLAIAKQLKRFQGDPMADFWHACMQLEILSEKIYQPWIMRWGLPSEPTAKSHFFASVLALIPKVLITKALKTVQKINRDHIEELHRMEAMAPPSAAEFMSYVVRQEQLCIELIDLALAEDFAQCLKRVSHLQLEYAHLCG